MSASSTSLMTAAPLRVRHTQKFPAAASSVAAARRFLRSVWPDAADDVLLATSELAANAIEHAGTEFEIYVELDGTSGSVAVRDWSPKSWPRPRSDVGLTERGRGLHMVGSLSHRWGWTTGTDSKVVWFEV